MQVRQIILNGLSECLSVFLVDPSLVVTTFSPLISLHVTRKVRQVSETETTKRVRVFWDWIRVVQPYWMIGFLSS